MPHIVFHAPDYNWGEVRADRIAKAFKDYISEVLIPQDEYEECMSPEDEHAIVDPRQKGYYAGAAQLIAMVRDQIERGHSTKHIEVHLARMESEIERSNITVWAR